MKTTNSTAPKRPPGRPRNTEIDALAAELGVSTRRARTVMAASKSASGDLSPLAEARLEKILKDIEHLEGKIRIASLREREIAGELMYLDEARELTAAGIQPIVASLQTLPKTLAARLHNQPQKSIERTLAQEADRIIEAARHATEKFKPSSDKTL